MFTIYKIMRSGHANLTERIIIKGFKHSNDMYKFLNTGRNALDWRETKDRKDLSGQDLSTLKPGTYARAGGRLHNVKSLDPSVLAHI